MFTVHLLSHGGLERVVPHALQVGRLAAGATAGDQQVAAVLEDEGDEAGVAARREALQAFVGRHRVVLSRPEIERHAPEHGLVVGEMAGLEVGEAPAGQRREGVVVACRRVAVHARVVHVTGGGDEHEGRAVRPLHDDRALACGDGPAVGGNDGARLEAHAPVGDLTAQHNLVGPLRCRLRRGVRAVHAGLEGDTGGLRCANPAHDRLVRIAGEALARVLHATGGVLHKRFGPIEDQPALVAEWPARRPGDLVPGERQPHVAERLVRLLADRLAHELARPDVLGLRLLLLGRLALRLGVGDLSLGREGLGLEPEPAPLVQQIPHRLEKRRRAFVGVVVRLPRPERALVELDALFGHAPEDHRAEAAVADRQRLHPPFRGLDIPERRHLGRPGGCGRWLRQRRRCDEGARHQREPQPSPLHRPCEHSRSPGAARGRAL